MVSPQTKTHVGGTRCEVRGLSQSVISFGCIAVLVGVGLAGSPATAQQSDEDREGRPSALEEIIVTAQRREQSLQDVAMSVSALSGNYLESIGADSLESITARMPGITFSQIGAGQRNGQNIVIRGVANGRFFGGVNDGAAALTSGFYVDDVPITPIDPTIFDINRVEVLKGPQGTLFGQASMGGTVRIFTNRPDATEFYGRGNVSSSYTNDATEPSFGGNLMFNVPLVEDQLAARFVVSRREEAGWIEHRTIDLDTGLVPRVGADVRRGNNDMDSLAARIQLQYTPTDRLTITPTYFWQDRRSGMESAYNRELSERFVRIGYAQESRGEDFSVASLSVTYEFDTFELAATSGRSTRGFLGEQDVTGFMVTSFGANPDGSIPSPQILSVDIAAEQRLQEIRLTSDGKLIDWLSAVVGFSYFEEDSDSVLLWEGVEWEPIIGFDGLVLEGIARGEYTNRSVYADVTVRPTESLSLTFGARAFDQNSEIRGISRGLFSGRSFFDPPSLAEANVNRPEEDGVTFRYNISYQFSDDVLVYASAADGYRLGGAGLPITFAPCVAAVENAGLTQFNNGIFLSDSVWNYELGLKSVWMDGRLLANLSVYSIDWTDLQSPVELNRFDPGCATVITANIGEATNRGVELDLRSAFLGESLEVTATFAYTEAEYGKPPEGVTIFQEGDKRPGVPEYTASLSTAYWWTILNDVQTYIRADTTYRSSMLAPDAARQDNPFERLASYTAANFRFGAELGKYDVAVFINNAFNAEAEFGAGPAFGVPTANRTLGMRPRTIGAQLDFSF